ncbi:hypothetical protein GCM10008967_20780 [Bacillus carboniphilus]|uniref:Uncharacterized protein n=1 Tax=Bacillus carboniphilus TaxID=86663 RepID=A0ABP3G009_9BACI
MGVRGKIVQLHAYTYVSLFCSFEHKLKSLGDDLNDAGINNHFFISSIFTIGFN